MILADENIDHNIIAYIRNAGIEVFSIYESLRGVSDEFILNFSLNPSRIILTEDKDFGEWIFAHNIKNVSLILLRYHFSETEKIKQIIAWLLTKRSSELWDAYTVVSTKKIRIRRLED